MKHCARRNPPFSFCSPLGDMADNKSFLHISHTRARLVKPFPAAEGNCANRASPITTIYTPQIVGDFEVPDFCLYMRMQPAEIATLLITAEGLSAIMACVDILLE